MDVGFRVGFFFKELTWRVYVWEFEIESWSLLSRIRGGSVWKFERYLGGFFFFVSGVFVVLICLSK